MELPDCFTANINKYFPGEAADFFESLKAKPYCGIRANTLKISPDALCEILGCTLTPVPWCREGFYYNADDFKPAKSPFYHAGLFYIQEPAAMSAVSAFDIKPDDKVLDISAAPGGKTTQIAARLNENGFIVANDVNRQRCGALIKNIEQMGITNAAVLNETPERLRETFAGYFDKILIDAPCSGEGMFRKDPEAVRNYTKYKSERLAAVQKSILFNANHMLKPGGEIMYSTCTFSPVENEMVIGRFLDTHRDYTIVPVADAYGFDNGSITGTARLWPHKHQCEGHFLARLTKGNNDVFVNKQGNNDISSRDKKHNKTGFDTRYFKQFCEDNLNIIWGENNFTCFGEHLYKTHKVLPSLDGLRVLRPGFYLGDIKKDRFSPSHAMAVALAKKDAKHTADFSQDDTDLYRYLRGESFPVPCVDGFCLVCAQGYPVGFGYVQNGRLKNKYPKSFVIN